MDPARMSMTLVLLLGLGGIGGAVKACASAGKAGSSAARVSSKAFRVAPKLPARLPTPVTRIGAGRTHRAAGAAVVGGSLSDDVARGAALRGTGVAGEEAAVGGVRATGAKGAAKVRATKRSNRSKVGDHAGDGLDLAGDDDDR